MGCSSGMPRTVGNGGGPSMSSPNALAEALASTRQLGVLHRERPPRRAMGFCLSVEGSDTIENVKAKIQVGAEEVDGGRGSSSNEQLRRGGWKWWRRGRGNGGIDPMRGGGRSPPPHLPQQAGVGTPTRARDSSSGQNLFKPIRRQTGTVLHWVHPLLLIWGGCCCWCGC